MSSVRISLVLFLVATSSSAQSTVFIPDADATKDLCNGIPFGIYNRPINPWAMKFKYQTLVTPAQYGSFAPKTIRDLAFASCADGVQSFSSITIKMHQTTATTLDRAFDKNLPATAVTVLNARNYYWHHVKDRWNWIGLENSFPFKVGLSLVIEIEVEGAKFLDTNFVHGQTTTGGFRIGALSVPRLWVADWNGAVPSTGKLGVAGLRIGLSSELASLGTFGIGCPGNGKTLPTLSLSGSAALGKLVNIALTQAKANTPAVLAMGFGAQFRLPYMPAALDGKGCNLYVAPHLALIAFAGSTGSTSVPIPIPMNSAFLNTVFNAQYFQVEQTPLALRASNYGRVLMGK